MAKKKKSFIGVLFMFLISVAGIFSLVLIAYVFFHTFPAMFKFFILGIVALAAWFFYKKRRVETPEEIRTRFGYTSDVQQNYSPTQYTPPVTTPTRRTRKPSKKLHLQIDYIDNDGIETSREIVISGKTKVDNYYIHAKCLLRNEQRMFKIHMVQHCFNPETGEFVSDIKKYVDDFYS